MCSLDGQDDPYRQLILNALWTDMSGLPARYDLGAASFDLPRYEQPQLPSLQTAFLLDDSDKRSELRLDDGRGMQAATLDATLYLRLVNPLPGTRPSGNLYPLVAGSIAADDSGRQVTLAFPSLAKLGIGADDIRDSALVLVKRPPRRYDLYPEDTPAGTAEQLCRVTDTDITVLSRPEGRDLPDALRSHLWTKDAEACRKGDKKDECVPCAVYQVAYQPLLRPEDLPGFSVTPVVGHVVLDKDTSKGKAELVVKLAEQGPQPASIVLSVTNGHVTKGTFGKNELKLLPSENAVEIEKPEKTMEVSIELDQLLAGDKVTVTPKGKRGDVVTGTPKPVDLEVKTGAQPAGGGPGK